MIRSFALVVCLVTVPAYGQTVCKNGQCYRAPVAVGSPVTTTATTLPQGLVLAPGERLISIDGKPYGSTPVAAPSAGLMPYEINRDPQAYAHAKRECQIMASRGRVYHPLGVASGCQYSGTGNSVSQRPNHCYMNMPESRIVARACVYANGRYWWSMHAR